MYDDRLSKVVLTWLVLCKLCVLSFIHYIISCYTEEQVAQLSQRNRPAGCVSFGQRWEDLDWETIFCRHYRSIFNQCDI